MRVCDVMIRELECVTPDTSIRRAFEIFADFELNALPVLEHGHAVGLLTFEDAASVTAHGHNPEEESVGRCMRPSLPTIAEETELAEARRWMEEQHLEKALVVDREARVVGAVALGDLAVIASAAEWFAGHEHGTPPDEA